MKTLKESLLDNEEDMVNDESYAEELIKKWIYDHYSIRTNDKKGIVINNNIVTLSAPGLIFTKSDEIDIKSLTNNIFKFGKIDGHFICNNCMLLKDLKGAPKEVVYNFECGGCKNLKTLKDMPIKIGGDFLCSECWDLKDFTTMPKNIKIGGSIIAKKLMITSIKGLPTIINGNLNLSNCEDLENLDGIKEIKGDLIIMGCNYQLRHKYKDKNNCPIKIGGRVLI